MIFIVLSPFYLFELRIAEEMIGMKESE
jgi:hypothetical protein